MVCDDISKGITVLTKDLKHVRTISSPFHDHYANYVMDVCSDEKGCLYVSDGGRCNYYEEMPGMTSLCPFGENRMRPSGVCMMTGEHVFVANEDNHCICVFTTKREHVNSFGQHGRNEGDFEYPTGGCVWTGMFSVRL